MLRRKNDDAGGSGAQAPGPRGHVLVGSLPEFRADPMEMLRKLQREHGDVVHFRLVNNDCYLFAHPDHVRHVLRTNSRNFRKAFLFDKIRVLLGNGLLPMPYEDDFWRQRRRLSQPPFHRKGLESYVRTWFPAVEAFLRRWHRYADSGKIFDAFPEMYSLSFDLAARTLLSVDAESAETDAVRAAFDVGLAHLKHKIEAFVDLPEWIPTPRNRRFLAARGVLDRVVYRLIDERRAAGAAAPEDFLTILLRAFDRSDDIDTRQLRDEVMTMFIAGFETVASALAWAIWMLASHPEWADAVRQEASSVLAGKAPGLDDLPRLKLTRMVLDETMRLHPPAWWIVRSTIAPDVIGGYRVPAGALVIVSPYVTHRHAGLWEEPDRFDPLRFSEGRAGARPALSFFPFGDGPRSCIGAQFSYVQMALVLAMLVERFDWRPLPRHHVGLMASATMRPKNGVWISVARRVPRPQGLDTPSTPSRHETTDPRRAPRKEPAMARKSVLTNDITDPYSDLEAWMYDTLFAPAVLDMVRQELASWCAALRPGAKVLDVGCGGGQIALAMLARRGDLHITGVDLSPAQVKRARERSRSFRERTRFEVGTALELPFEDRSFDAVLSVTSIKHWPSPLRGMQECLRVLKAGGDLLLVEVDRGSRLEAVRALMSRSRVPKLLRGPALPLLRTFIVGQGMDLDDFRELLSTLTLVDGRVARLEGMPGIALTARRAGAVVVHARAPVATQAPEQPG
jgi:cytochrome P450/ubiquinone/menaquinone biosynthesis C-methylase UbiE